MLAFLLLSTFVIWGMLAATGLWWWVCFPVLGRFSPAGWIPVLGTALILAGITLTRTHYNVFTTVLYYVAYLLFGFVFIAFCITALSAGLFFLLKLLGITARVYLGSLSVGISLVLFACGVWGGFKTPPIKYVVVNSSALPALKIALISDTHLGMGVSYARWHKALSRLEKEKPDILLVLGDIFEYGPHADQYAARLAAFQTPLGTYGVLGNHEYYNDFQKSLDFYKKAHITLLQNEAVSLPNGLQIAGLKDIKTVGLNAKDITDLLTRLDNNKPLILLSHTPLYAEEAAAYGTDLMLSGHTHNGQIWPFGYLVKGQFPRVYGLFKVAEMSFYITSGMFYWGIPLRLFSPAELPILEVRP